MILFPKISLHGLFDPMRDGLFQQLVESAPLTRRDTLVICFSLAKPECT